jgi:hypothetical protein
MVPGFSAFVLDSSNSMPAPAYVAGFLGLGFQRVGFSLQRLFLGLGNGRRLI